MHALAYRWQAMVFVATTVVAAARVGHCQPAAAPEAATDDAAFATALQLLVPLDDERPYRELALKQLRAGEYAHAGHLVEAAIAAQKMDLDTIESLAGYVAHIASGDLEGASPNAAAAIREMILTVAAAELRDRATRDPKPLIDRFYSALRMFGKALGSEPTERGLKLVDELAGLVEKSSPEYRPAMVDYLAGVRVELLMQAGRADQAAADAQRRMDAALAAYRADCSGYGRRLMWDRFALLMHALPDRALVDDKSAEALNNLYTEISDFQLRSLEQTPADEEKDDRLYRIRGDCDTMREGNMAYVERLLAAGRADTAKSVLNKFDYSVEFADHGTNVQGGALETDRRQLLWGYHQFASTLVVADLRLEVGGALLKYLSDERWVNAPSGATPLQLKGKVVAIALGAAAAKKRGRPPATMAEVKEQIDQHLAQDGLTTSDVPLEARVNLREWCERFPAESFALISICDDDPSYSLDGAAGDAWAPESKNGLDNFLALEAPAHPVVYVYNSKLLDTLIARDEPRLILLDRHGNLRRVYCRLPGDSEFDWIAPKIQQLVDESQSTAQGAGARD